MTVRTGKGQFEQNKVLICTHIYPPDKGGIATSIKNIYELLQNAGSDVTIFKADIQNKTKTLHRFFALVVTFFRLLARIVQFRPDVVICSRLLPLGPVALFWSSVFSFRVIIQVHGIELQHRYEQETYLKGLRKGALKKIYNRADQLWANSKYTSDLLKEHGYNQTHIKIIYPFITRNAQRLAAQVNGRAGNKRFTLITATSVYSNKGIDLVMKALSKLEGVDWEYRIAGEPYNSGYEAIYERFARRLGIADKVKFLGYLDRTDLWEEMAHADLFIMPSRSLENVTENFGTAFIEAQMFGVPCMGTDVGGIREAIGEGGIVLESHDKGELTELIKHLANNSEEWNRLSSCSLDRIDKNFIEQSRYQDIEKALAVLQQ